MPSNEPFKINAFTFNPDARQSRGQEIPAVKLTAAQASLAAVNVVKALGLPPEVPADQVVVYSYRHESAIISPVFRAANPDLTDEVLSKKLADFISPKSAQLMAGVTEALAASGRMAPAERRVLPKDEDLITLYNIPNDKQSKAILSFLTNKAAEAGRQAPYVVDNTAFDPEVSTKKMGYLQTSKAIATQDELAAMAPLFSPEAKAAFSTFYETAESAGEEAKGQRDMNYRAGRSADYSTIGQVHSMAAALRLVTINRPGSERDWNAAVASDIRADIVLPRTGVNNSSGNNPQTPLYLGASIKEALGHVEMHNRLAEEQFKSHVMAFKKTMKGQIPTPEELAVLAVAEDGHRVGVQFSDATMKSVIGVPLTDYRSGVRATKEKAAADAKSTDATVAEAARKILSLDRTNRQSLRLGVNGGAEPKAYDYAASRSLSFPAVSSRLKFALKATAQAAVERYPAEYASVEDYETKLETFAPSSKQPGSGQPASGTTQAPAASSASADRRRKMREELEASEKATQGTAA